MIDLHSAFLLASTLIAVVSLILLVAVFKLNPFLSLLLVSLGLGAAAGMPLATVIHSFELGMGNTLGHIAIVVALGTMLGKMMAESGAADTIALTLIRWFGERRVPLAMVTAGLVIGLPAFFEVGFVLLIPIAFTVARRTRTSLILVCLPMVAGLSVVHGLVPPHPAAMMAVMIYKADVGRTIFYGLLVAVPTALIAGPLFARIIAPYVHIADKNPMAEELAEHDTSRSLPGFPRFRAYHPAPGDSDAGWELGRLACRKGSVMNQALRLIGNDDMALLAEFWSASSPWARCADFRGKWSCASAMNAWRPRQ